MEIINIKCGEIYLTKNSSYYFYCIHCSKEFSSLECFKQHNLNHFLIDVNSVANATLDNVAASCNAKSKNFDDEEYQNIEMLDHFLEEKNYNIKSSHMKNNVSYSENEERDNFDVIGLDMLDNIKIERQECNSSNSDENDDKFYNKVIKIEIENDSDSLSESLNTNTIINNCSHCELSFPTAKKHDSQQCEIVKKKITKYKRNLRFLKIDGIYLCKDCPRYYESSNELENHQKKHNTTLEICNKNFKNPIDVNGCGNNSVIDDISESCSEYESEVDYNKNSDELKIIKCKNSTNIFYDENDFMKQKNLCNDPKKLQWIEEQNVDGINKLKTQNETYYEVVKSDTEKCKKKENSTKCPHCNITFKSFQKHDHNKCLSIQKIITMKSKNRFEILRNKGIHLCRECPRYFENETELVFHRRKHYNNGRCSVCFKSFKRLDIIEHMKSVHPDTPVEELTRKSKAKKSYDCSYCKRKFVSMTYWKRHLLIHENNELQCEFCSKVCQSPLILKNHLRTHTGERPFTCQLCPAAFSLKHNLDLHFIYKHTEERPYECRYDGGCGKSFKTDQLRNYHERRHTGEILGKCEICGIEYRNKSAFRKHMKLRHMNYNERPYQCEYCDKKFVEFGRLREHIRTHTGEKPLQCDVCFKGFARYSVLREHKKLHTGIKNHVCSICGKAFAQTAGYFNHLKYHS